MARRKQSNPRRVPKMFQKTHVFKSGRYKRRRAYAPKRKKAFIRKSNPIAENKQVEGKQLTQYFGNKADGYPILNDFSTPPVNGPTHPDAGDPTDGRSGHLLFGSITRLLVVCVFSFMLLLHFSIRKSNVSIIQQQ